MALSAAQTAPSLKFEFVRVKTGQTPGEKTPRSPMSGEACRCSIWIMAGIAQGQGHRDRGGGSAYTCLGGPCRTPSPCPGPTASRSSRTARPPTYVPHPHPHTQTRLHSHTRSPMVVQAAAANPLALLDALMCVVRGRRGVQRRERGRGRGRELVEECQCGDSDRQCSSVASVAVAVAVWDSGSGSDSVLVSRKWQ